MVKKSHQQATYDMLVASRAVLDHMKLSSTSSSSRAGRRAVS